MSASNGPISPELPPRARRIRAPPWVLPADKGTTSACAENTTWYNIPLKIVWNYLRVRGEYGRQQISWPTLWELPPRARRILLLVEERAQDLGTTSACAENTGIRRPRNRLDRNYLRVRGEYSAMPYFSNAWSELPPRARRIPFLDAIESAAEGTTSACAENT